MAVVRAHHENRDCVINCYARLTRNEDPLRLAIPKVVLDGGDRLPTPHVQRLQDQSTREL